MRVDQPERVGVVEFVEAFDVALNAPELVVHDDILLLLIRLVQRPERRGLLARQVDVLLDDVRAAGLQIQAHRLEDLVHRCEGRRRWLLRGGPGDCGAAEQTHGGGEHETVAHGASFKTIHQGVYISDSMCLRTLFGRRCRASFIAYAFVATLTAMASEIFRISLSGG